MKRTKSMIYNPTVESRELVLYATNTGELYRGQTAAVIKNLAKKVKRGIYDKEKAIDLWYSVATTASNLYKKEFGYSFSVGDRFTAAVELEDYYKEEIQEG